MILHGNARSGGRNLAHHLMRTDENEHVEVHEIEGFMADDVLGALKEVEALSMGTRCQKPLFSLSLSPPKDANLTAKQFENAIAKAEESLGLRGQPRVIVFHEKGDHRDRHCHVVWSRINATEMKAIPMPFNRLKMRDVSRELFIEHGHEVPRGLIDKESRDPLNFTLEEYQQAKRIGRDARSIKADIQNAWAGSDSRAALEHALEDKGFRLARGIRRGFVVTDSEGEVYSLPRMLSVKTKAVRERLGSEKDLPALDDVKAAYAKDMAQKMAGHQQELKARNQSQTQERNQARQVLIEKQRAERAAALEAINIRQVEETKARQSKFRKGLGGLWDFVRGENARIKRENEAEAVQALARDQAEKEALFVRQREQRRFHAQRVAHEKTRISERYKEIAEDRTRYQQTASDPREDFKKQRQAQLEQNQRRARSRRPEP